MRSFVTATLILSFIILVTICNSVYVSARVDEMLSVCEKLKSDSSALLTDELISRWQDCRDILSLTTHRGEIERAENAVLSLEYYIDTPADYSTQLSILISVLEHIGSSQHLSFENIF